MLPASNAADAYHFVCRHLHVSPRARVPIGLTALPNRPSTFIARTVESDAHAVALCSAFLVSHGVPWQRVLHFVNCFVVFFLDELNSSKTLPTNTTISSAGPELTTVSTSSFATMPLLGTVTGDSARAYMDKTVVTVDFSESSALTSLGAAAVVSACLVLPPPVCADVDLRHCPAVFELNLSPWCPLLNSFGAPPPAVAGLALDGCPLRGIPLQTLHYLSHLRWISLRGTRLRNFGRIADIVGGLPSLVAALFSGHPCNNDLRRAQHVAHGEPETVATFAAGSSNVYESANLGELDHENISLREWEMDGDDGDDFHKWSPHASELNSDVPNGNPLSHTPASLRGNFRRFVLASRSLPLRFLDGAIVAPREHAAARTAVAAHLEPVQRRPRATRLLSLLRDRELGRGPRSADVWMHSNGIRADRPRKRKRSILEHASSFPNHRSQHPDHSFSVANFQAIVAAARFSPHAVGSVLSGSHQMAVALAAAAANSCDTNLTHASLPANHQHHLSTVPASDPKYHRFLRSHSERRRRRRRGAHTRIPSHPFCEGLFEHCASSTLVRRKGPPRLAFWKQGNDRPRQFEYNPAKASEVVYATANGFLVVINEASGIVEASCRAGGGPGIRRCGTSIARTTDLRDAIAGGSHEPAFTNNRAPAVFGISWLNTARDIFISGKYGGDIHVYNVDWMRTGRHGGCMYACEGFDRLTSISVSADDARFAVSGESSGVGIYDLLSGKRLETMLNCHTNVINVIKFAHHNPFVLLTSSFDGCVRKWDLRERRPNGSRRPIFTTHSRTDNMMACFSPDDQYLLVSAIDNDVKQYSACDGRLILDFDIVPTGNRHNYTRSYYMNNRDYIVSGSCMESVVRVYNATSGALLTEVDVDNRHIPSDHQLCVQSLRANPCRPFNFCALLVSKDDSVDEIIAQVDLRIR